MSFCRTRSFLRRPLAAVVVATVASAGLLVAVAGPASAASNTAFTAVYTTNTTGDILLRGNTMMTCAIGSTAIDKATPCASAQSGATAQTDNQYNMVYVDVDSDSTTFDSSSATVTLPAGATVLYAGLTWGATTSAGSAGNVTGGAARNTALNNTVQLKAPGATTYATVVSSRNNAGVQYQGFADVTAAVTQAGSGVYTVANVQSGTGPDRYAGWALAVAYRDIAQPNRNLVIYNGYNTLSNPASVDIAVSGFTTPASGPVVTRLGVVGYEGDRALTGDSLTLGSTPISNTLNPVSDIFNSTISDLDSEVTERNPYYENTLGYDIDRFDATGALANGATSTTIHLTTSSETYYAGMVTFATNLYSPTLVATKTVTDVNGGNVSRGDVLAYSISVTNTGLDAAATSVFTDATPTGTTYVAGSLLIGGTAVTDASGDDAGNASSSSVTARIGVGATASAGGSIAPAATTTVAFQVRVGSTVADAALVSNTAALTYNAATSGTALSGPSTTATSTVIVPPALANASPPAGTVGTAYTYQLTAVDGTGPYAWSSSGSLPAGLTLNGSTGLLSGTPSATGSSTFTVTVTDAHGHADGRSVTLVVNALTATIGLTSSASSVAFGAPVTLTATVGPGSPTGTVTFTDVASSGAQSGTTVTLGTGTVDATSGVAMLTVTPTAFGANTIVAVYGGDATHTATTSSSKTVEVRAYLGQVIINEFRASGPGGIDDSYVELYNTGPPMPLAGFVVDLDSGADITLPSTAGTLGTRRSYLITGSSYSLAAVATADLTANSGSGGVQLLAPDSASTRTDAVGFATGSHRGTPLPPVTGSLTAQYAWVRIETAGAPRSTGDNATDLRLVSTNGAILDGQQSILGSPSPTGSVDPFQHNGGLLSTLLDPSVGNATPANRVYVQGSPGTLTIRRTITNTTGQTITAAKVRITSISEANGVDQPGVSTQPTSVAQLKVVNPSSATSTVIITDGSSSTVHNLSPDAPSVAGNGGGLNTTLSIPLPGGGLANNQSISVALTFSVVTRGTYWFGYDIDATGATGFVAGRGPQVTTNQASDSTGAAGPRVALTPTTASDSGQL